MRAHGFSMLGRSGKLLSASWAPVSSCVLPRQSRLVRLEVIEPRAGRRPGGKPFQASLHCIEDTLHLSHAIPNDVHQIVRWVQVLCNIPHHARTTFGWAHKKQTAGTFAPSSCLKKSPALPRSIILSPALQCVPIQSFLKVNTSPKIISRIQPAPNPLLTSLHWRYIQQPAGTLCSGYHHKRTNRRRGPNLGIPACSMKRLW